MLFQSLFPLLKGKETTISWEIAKGKDEIKMGGLSSKEMLYHQGTIDQSLSLSGSQENKSIELSESKALSSCISYTLLQNLELIGKSSKKIHRAIALPSNG
jgi:hypothetical protein